jgi:hypothetical protein
MAAPMAVADALRRSAASLMVGWRGLERDERVTVGSRFSGTPKRDAPCRARRCRCRSAAAVR